MKGLTFRLKLMVILIIAVTLPLVGSGYVLITQAEHGLLVEKENKLFGIAHSLDQELHGDFDSLLSPQEQQLPREEKVKLLNRKLAALTDELVKANPGVGAGYYSKDLDAIITYGPSDMYGNTIGESITSDHKGRYVMANGVTMSVSGPGVRGNILNAMVPIKRDNRVIGYTWANELTQNIDMQISKMEKFMYLAVGLALALGLAIVLPIANGLSNSVHKIVEGLRLLRRDLGYKLPVQKGEFGEITSAINEMAVSLSNTRSHTEIIMESMADGIITVDNEGKITALNAAATRITGLTRDVIGKDYSDIHVRGLLLETLRTGKTFIGYEVNFPHAKGGNVPISISSSLLFHGGIIIGAVVVFKDLTEYKIFEERVRRVDRLAAVGELAAGVAHEIRNPLASISGSVQILIGELPEDHSSRVFGDVIIKEVNRLNRIIEDLLYFAKPSKNLVMPINPNELVEETLSLIEPSVKQNMVSLKKNFDTNVKLLTVDPGLIKQVIINLLLNAVQALPKCGGNLTVSTQSVAKGVEIQVQDNGQGMSEHTIDRIFDPFYTTKDRGTGLGLAVSTKIIEIHHGYINVQSAPGVGSIFTVFLPYETEEVNC